MTDTLSTSRPVPPAIWQVKEGELSVDEALEKVKGQTALAHGSTIKKGMKLATGGKKGFNRQGGIRKNRGRLLLDFQVVKASAFGVLVLRIIEGRDLMEMNKHGTADPYVKMYMLPDAKKKKTCVRKNTCNPVFEPDGKEELFRWEVRTDSDLEAQKLCVADAACRRSRVLSRRRRSAATCCGFVSTLACAVRTTVSGRARRGPWPRRL